MIKKVKIISGGRWNPKKKYRKVLYSEGIISKLQNSFAEKIFIASYFYLMLLQKEFLLKKYLGKTIKSYMRYNRDFAFIF